MCATQFLQFDRCSWLNSAVWRAACSARVALHQPTHRGFRGGVHKLQRTLVKQMGINSAKLLNTNVRPAKLCLLTARSACNKADFFVNYVADHDLDMSCITETWPSCVATVPVSAITPCGHLLEHVARSNLCVSVLFK